MPVDGGYGGSWHELVPLIVREVAIAISTLRCGSVLKTVSFCSDKSFRRSHVRCRPPRAMRNVLSSHSFYTLRSCRLDLMSIKKSWNSRTIRRCQMRENMRGTFHLSSLEDLWIQHLLHALSA